MKSIFLISIIFLGFRLLAQKSSTDSVFVFYFKSAQSKIQTDSILKFQKFYKKFENCHNCVFELRGFADSVGEDNKNKILSEKRIASVKSLLKKTKLEQVKEIPFGERLSQNAKNNQDFRKVILSISSKKSISIPSISNTSRIDTLPLKEQRFIQFKERNKAIRLNILFHLNRSDLIEESTDDIIYLANYLQENPNLTIKLEGHVCCDNNDTQLSRLRALEVKKMLIYKKIKADRIKVEGFGNTRPLVEEKTEADEQLNRRVEVIFYE